jgi:hypothetical protein
MKKVLSLVLALVLVLGMIPTFAAGETGAELLFEHNFIVGDENGNLMVEKVLTRDEMTVLFAQMYGKEVEAAAFVAPANFTDADTFGWAANFISFAQASEWIVGYPDGTYQPKNVVTGKELLSALMQVLGYEFTWETVVADAAAVGLTVSTEGPILRGAAFETMWIAVSAIEINGEGMTIGEKTGKIAPVAPVVVDLALVKVSATNLREVMVEFNNEIDVDTLDKANFTIDTIEATSVNLSADGKTVVAWFTLLNQTAYTLEIAKIADVNGSILTDLEAQFTATDFAAPVVEGVQVFGNKKLVVTFSEPVNPTTGQILGNYRINDLLFGGMIVVEGRTASITLTNRLPEGVHALSVSTDVTDFAGFKLVANNTQFAVGSDTTAPVLARVVSASQTTVVIEFNEPVENNFIVYPVASSLPTTGDVQYTLTFADPLPLSGTEITLTDVMDYYGNMATIKFSVVPTLDLVRPEVVSVTATAQNTILVEFTKEVDLNGTYVLNTVATEPVTIALNAPVHFKDDYGVVVKTKVVLTDNADLELGDYTLEVSGVQDLTPLKNTVIPSVTRITVPDLTLPTVVKVAVTHPLATTDGVAYIEFSEKVDATTALNKANYSYILNSVKHVSLGTTHTISLLADGKTVKITLPMTADGPVTSFTIVNVTDLVGNIVDATVKFATLEVPFATPNVSPIEVTAPVAVAVNKIEVTVPSNINPYTVTASDFTVTEFGETATLISVINAEYDGETTITLTLNSDLSNVATFNSKSVAVRLVANNLADIFGNKVDFGVQTSVTLPGNPVVADGIVPVATGLVSTTVPGGTLTAVVELSENLDLISDDAVASTTEFIIVVNGVKIDDEDVDVVYTEAVVATTTVAAIPARLTITTKGTTLVGLPFKVSFYGTTNYADAANNKLANFEFSSIIK